MKCLCSVASELSNYDSCQTVHFWTVCAVVIMSVTVVILRDDVIRGQSVGGSSRNGGVYKVGKKFVGA